MNNQFNESTNQKSPKLLSQQIKKHYYKTLVTNAINSPLSPLSLSHSKILKLGEYLDNIK